MREKQINHKVNYQIRKIFFINNGEELSVLTCFLTEVKERYSGRIEN